MDNYYARDFGALGDGVSIDTQAIQKAIDTCNKNSGGCVILDNGTFVAGTLYLKSNVYLQINISAKLLANPDISDYGLDTHYNRYANEKDMDLCFIYAENCEHIGIVGNGEINGNSECFPNENSIYRPMMIRFLNCKQIHIKGLKLYNAVAWTTAFLDCQNIWADGLDIYNDKKYNGDGLDFDGCENVFVSNCKLLGTDDNLCLQASSKMHPSKNIHINNCMFTSVCAGIRIGLKSIGDISGVVINNCTFKNVWREGIKIECTEGGRISDIIISGIIMHNVSRPIFILLNNRLEKIGSSVGLMEVPAIGSMERIIISDIIAVDSDEMENTHYRFNNDIMGSPLFSGIRVDAEEHHPIQALTLKNIHYTFVGGVKLSDIPIEYPKVLDMRFPHQEKSVDNYYPDWSRASFIDIRNVNNLKLEEIYLKLLRPDERPPYVLENVNIININVDNLLTTNRLIIL